jgi:hypothetical protein
MHILKYWWGLKSPPFIGVIMTIGPVISYPIPAYQNVPIQAQFYQPSRFFISNITLGKTTLVTTTVQTNYVVGQLVRLLIPYSFGCRQLNEQTGYVISTTFENIAFINNQQASTNGAGGLYIRFIYPFSGLPANTMIIPGTFEAVTADGFTYSETNPPSGLLNLNGNPTTSEINYSTGRLFLSGPTLAGRLVFVTYQYEIPLNPNQVEVNIDSTINVDPFVAATTTTQPQIVAVGDINTGAINATGRNNTSTFIPGSFIDISPL